MQKITIAVGLGILMGGALVHAEVSDWLPWNLYKYYTDPEYRADYNVEHRIIRPFADKTVAMIEKEVQSGRFPEEKKEKLLKLSQDIKQNPAAWFAFIRYRDDFKWEVRNAEEARNKTDREVERSKKIKRNTIIKYRAKHKQTTPEELIIELASVEFYDVLVHSQKYGINYWKDAGNYFIDHGIDEADARKFFDDKYIKELPEVPKDEAPTKSGTYFSMAEAELPIAQQLRIKAAEKVPARVKSYWQYESRKMAEPSAQRAYERMEGLAPMRKDYGIWRGLQEGGQQRMQQMRERLSRPVKETKPEKAMRTFGHEYQ